MAVFDVLTTPIEKDKIMIEASAGTGKTYSIGILTLRLLLEKNYKINEIVLVTFTNAAAFELKTRTLEVIKQAKNYIERSAGFEQIDTNIKQVVDQFNMDAQNKLEDAILHMNEALIFTIHGFCSYLASKYPFEFNLKLNNQLVDDDAPIVEKLIHDFFRYELNTLPKAVIEHVKDTFSDVKSHIYKIRELFSKPDAHWYGYDEGVSIKKKYEALVKKLNNALTGQVENLCRENSKFLETEDGYYDKDVLYAFLASNGDEVLPYTSMRHMDVWNQKTIELSYKKVLPKAGVYYLLDAHYTKRETIDERKSKWYNDEHELDLYYKSFLPIFLAATDYFEFFENIAFYMYYYVIKRLKLERDQINIKTNDDLIMDIYGNLEKVDTNIFSPLKVLMVDEFQDTDHIQYQIFDKVFTGKPFLMIGDPKQAMYRFRGGDIDTYKAVRSDAKTIYTMHKNYRSEQTFLDAVNTYFNSSFAFEKSRLTYETIEAGNKGLMPPNDGIKPMVYKSYDEGNIRSKQQQALNDLVSEITRLKRDVKIKEKSVENSDIAILVNTHDLAKKIQKALYKAHIPSVLLKTKNIFESSEARFLMILLEAVLGYNMESKVNALLSHKFMPKTFTYETLNDPALNVLKSQIIEDLNICYQNVAYGGILKSLSIFMDKYDIIGSLHLDLVEGKRSISNFRLLFEIIGTLEKENNSLYYVLNQFMQLKDKHDEAYEERLDTDENVINIMTFHASKGLEWPFVFLYNVNGASSRVEAPYKYHMDDKLYYTFSKTYLTKDNQKFQPSEIEKSEILAEKERVLYVALTRAKYRTYILHGESRSANYFKDVIQIKDLPKFEVHNSINPVFKKSKDEIPSKNIKQFTKHHKLFDRYKYASFSNLTSFIKTEATLSKSYEDLIFPVGAQVGSVVHKIFEDLDFSNPKLDKLSNYFKHMDNVGINEIEWLKTCIINTLEKPFIDDKYKLNEIDSGLIKHELEFLMTSNQLSLEGLSNFLSLYHIPHEVERITQVKGYLNGIIDLVFYKDGKYYILDWKTNYLGKDASFYDAEAIEKEMKHHLYHLQYLIYTVALVRYLKLVKKDFDYDKDFGGIYYLFVRGINPNNNHGIYFDKPKKEIIDTLNDLIGDTYVK